MGITFAVLQYSATPSLQLYLFLIYGSILTSFRYLAVRANFRLPDSWLQAIWADLQIGQLNQI